MPKTVSFSWLILLSFCPSLLASATPSQFVDKDSKIGRILQWFQKSDCPSLTDIETLARKEVDVAEESKKAGYTVPEDADTWNKLASLNGQCSTTEKPDLLIAGSLQLKNHASPDGLRTYVFPTWDREANHSILLYNPLRILTDLGDFGPELGVKFTKFLGSPKESRQFRSSPVVKDTSILVDALTFATTYEDAYAEQSIYNHRMNYELRKMTVDTKTYYVLKEILASSDFEQERANVGKTTRACLFQLKD